MKILQKSLLSLSLLPIAAQLSGCGAAAGMKPSQLTTTQFLQQMQKHKFPTAYQLLNSQCKVMTKPQAMGGLWGQLEKNRGKVNNWTQTGVQFYSGTGGSNVKLAYSLQCAKGMGTIQFSVVPENDKWLIQGFDIRW